MAIIKNDYDQLMSNLFEGVYVVDTNRKIIFWNSGCENITGYSKEEVVNRHCFDNILQHVDEQGNQLCFGGCPLHRTLKTGDTTESSVFLKHKHGYRVPITVRSVPIYDDDNKIVAAIEVFSDNRFKQDLFAENRRLQQLVVRDELTGIYNRRYLDFQLKTTVEEFFNFNQPFGILFVDIDNFKQINDAYGHSVGDRVIKMIATTIDANIRNTDMFGRWGGEEFIVIVKGAQFKGLLQIAEKLRILVQNSEIVDEKGRILKATISLGGSIFHPTDTIDEVINRADRNMYEAKQNGRNQTVIK